MSLLNVYNLALCTEDFDGANKQYVSSRNFGGSNIGIGASFYAGTQNSTVLIRSIPTCIFTNNLNDNTNIL
jgi:hypothetical protein